MKYEKLILYGIFIMFLLTIVFLAFGIKDSRTCLANPLKYGAESIKSDYTGELTCFCSFENQEMAPFTFNSENISVLGK